MWVMLVWVPVWMVCGVHTLWVLCMQHVSTMGSEFGYYACIVWQHMYCAHMCSTISILCALYWYCVWICRCCVCVLKTCVQCVDSVDTVWVLWVSLCFPSLTGACSWKHGFRSSMGVWRSCQSWCIAEPGLVGHQWTQRLVNPVFCILIGPQKPLHPSDLFFIFAHVSSGDVSKAFSKFPFGIYVPQEGVAPWQVFGGHFRTLDCSREVLNRLCPSFLAASTYRVIMAAALCRMSTSQLFSLCSSSGGFLHLCLQCQQHWEFPVEWSWGHGSPVDTSGEKVRVFDSRCAHQVEIFLGIPWSCVLRTWSNMKILLPGITNPESICVTGN